MRTTIYLLLAALVAIPCKQVKAQETKSVKLSFKTYTNWETKYDEYNSDAEYYELSIPDFFEGNNSATIQLYHYGTEGNISNSTISLINKEGAFLTTLLEPTQFHEMALQYTTLSVADIDGNGLKDIKIEFPYMGNGLMACAVRTIYVFQENNKKFNKVSFDSFVCQEDVSEIDVDNDGKYEIVARTMEYIDEENSYWVENLYKYTPEGLVCVSKENGYPKVANVYEDKSTDAKIVTKIKNEWKSSLPDEYLFLKSTDPEAAIFTQPPMVYDNLENEKWARFTNDELDYIIEYPVGFEPSAIDDSTVKFGEMFSINVQRLSSDEIRLGSPDKILKFRYEKLYSNPEWATTKKIKDNLYGYADFYGIDHPNIKSRAIIALCQDEEYVYELYCNNPNDKTAKVFLEILARFQISLK